LDKLGLSGSEEDRPAVRSRDIVDIMEGHEGQGYGLSTDEELGIMGIILSCWINNVKVSTFSWFLAQLVEISSQTGIVLDPVYTLKGVRGMLMELNKNPKRFRGNRILYIHTGSFVTIAHPTDKHACVCPNMLL
jgi:hypothetical protein